MAAPYLGVRQSSEENISTRTEKPLERKHTWHINQLSSGKQTVKALRTVNMNEIRAAFADEVRAGFKIFLSAMKKDVR
jgi:hypothetical protein